MTFILKGHRALLRDKGRFAPRTGLSKNAETLISVNTLYRGSFDVEVSTACLTALFRSKEREDMVSNFALAILGKFPPKHSLYTIASERVKTRGSPRAISSLVRAGSSMSLRTMT